MDSQFEPFQRLIYKIGYIGEMRKFKSLKAAIKEGTTSIDFRKLICWITDEIRVLAFIDVKVCATVELKDFIIQITAFLKKMMCPFAEIMSVPNFERLRSLESRFLLLEYLIGELMAIKMCLQIKEKEEAKECPVASALKAITLNLNMGVPPAQISAKVLFDKIGLRIDGILQKAGHNLIGQPLFKPMLPLTPVQWKKLQSHQSELESEYDLRREMMLIRLDVDVQKLKFSHESQGRPFEVSQHYIDKRNSLDKMQTGGKSTDLVALLVAREELAIIAEVSAENQTNIGQVKAAAAHSSNHSDGQRITTAKVKLAPAIKVRPLQHLLGNTDRSNAAPVIAQQMSRPLPIQRHTYGEQISTDSGRKPLPIQRHTYDEQRTTDSGRKPSIFGNNIEFKATTADPPPIILIDSDSEPETPSQVRASTVRPTSKVSENICTVGDNGRKPIESSDINVMLDDIDFQSIAPDQKKMLKEKWKQYIKTNPTMAATGSRHEYSTWYVNEVKKLKAADNDVQRITAETIKRKGDRDSPKGVSLNKRSRKNIESKSRTKMLIVDAGYPKKIMDAIEAMRVKKCLFQARNVESATYLYFTEVQYYDGGLQLTCIGDNSMTWMDRIVPTLKPWAGASLRAVLCDDKTVAASQSKENPPIQPNFVKAVVFLPYEEISYEEVFAKLAQQNWGLNTHVWKFIEMMKEKVGQTMIVHVDEPSAEHLKQLDFMAKINSTRIKFRIPRERKIGGNNASRKEEDFGVSKAAAGRQSVASNCQRESGGNRRNNGNDDKSRRNFGQPIRSVERKESPKNIATNKK